MVAYEWLQLRRFSEISSRFTVEEVIRFWSKVYFKQNIGQSQEDFPLQAVQLEQLNINQVDKTKLLKQVLLF